MHAQCMRRLTTARFPSPPPAATLADHGRKLRNMLSEGLHEESLLFYKHHLHPLLFSPLPPPYHHGDNHHHLLLLLLPSLVKACFSCSSHHFYLGLQLQALSLKTASLADPLISNSLISMHAAFSFPNSAHQLFDEMPHRDAVSYYTLINCYSRSGDSRLEDEALRMFVSMHACGCFAPFRPQLVATVLSIVGRRFREDGSSLRLGKAIHGVVTVDGSVGEDCSGFLSSALANMYMNDHNAGAALRVFERMNDKRNEVSWTVMVSGYEAMGSYASALQCFQSMQGHGLRPNRVTLIAVMPVCAELGALKHAKQIHAYGIRHIFDSESRFSAALIHLYSQLGEKALPTMKLIFERSKRKDVVTWSALIRSHSQGGGALEALSLYQNMRMVGEIEPNLVTLLAVISACSNLNSLSYGRGIHSHAFKFGFHDSDSVIANSLIHMYSKCGCIEGAIQIFKETDVKEVATWTAVIGACGVHGRGEEALHLFRGMQESGLEPDGITYLSVLSACKHAGLVMEGQKLFHDAIRSKRELLTVEHYACYLCMLGKAGNLEDACDVLSTMPRDPSMRMWSSLLSSCKLHGRLEVAEKLAWRLIESEPENAAHYTALSMVFGESANWIGVEEVRKLMGVKNLHKNVGFSQVEFNG